MFAIQLRNKTQKRTTPGEVGPVKSELGVCWNQRMNVRQIELNLLRSKLTPIGITP
jgi:hypothetical protein